MSHGQNIPGIPPEMFKGMNSQNPKPSQGGNPSQSMPPQGAPPQGVPPQGAPPQGGQGNAPLAIESDLAMYLVVGVLAWKGWKMYLGSEEDNGFCDNKSICEKIDDCDLDFSH